LSDAPAAPPPARLPEPDPVSPWAGAEPAEQAAEPSAAEAERLGLDPARAMTADPGRPSRRWADATTAVLLLVCAGAILAAASPAIGRAFTPEPPRAARRGVAQAVRLRSLGLGSLEEGLPSEGHDALAVEEQPSGAGQDDPFGGPGRAGSALERLGHGFGHAGVGASEPGAAGEDDGAPRYRLGVATIGTVLRDRPDHQAAVLAQIASGEVLLVAAAVEGWLYVAFATEQGTVVGWIPRAEVALP
jgi:hypothetical protein